ncbi:hypothetical protein ACRAWF_03970 [Streptomyces sp. L7]
MTYWNQHGMSGWDWFAMSVGSVLLWALLATIAVLLIRNPEPYLSASAPPRIAPARAGARRPVRPGRSMRRSTATAWPSLRTDGSRLTGTLRVGRGTTTAQAARRPALRRCGPGRRVTGEPSGPTGTRKGAGR